MIAKTPPRLFLAQLATRDLAQLNEVWLKRDVLLAKTFRLKAAIKYIEAVGRAKQPVHRLRSRWLQMLAQFAVLIDALRLSYGYSSVLIY